ncbi:MAG: hypothetical protein CENE_00274 [Candidatus Celerinatantimonas neptuna]|nr:MAG: hypothetical protein CENE_00274 [Candidatus Celerinatantimonas neptuna]
MNHRQTIEQRCCANPRKVVQSRLIAYFKDAYHKRRMRKAKHRTLRELRRLNTHILNDIGIDHRTFTTVKQNRQD